MLIASAASGSSRSARQAAARSATSFTRYDSDDHEDEGAQRDEVAARWSCRPSSRRSCSGSMSSIPSSRRSGRRGRGTGSRCRFALLTKIDERLAEEQRHDRQVVADQPARRQPDEHAEHRGRGRRRPAPRARPASGCPNGPTRARRSCTRRSRRRRRTRGRAGRRSPTTMFRPSASMRVDRA